MLRLGTLFLFGALALGACNDDAQSTPADLSVPLDAQDDMAMCPRSCGTCADDEVCIGSGSTARYGAVCVKTCDTDMPCAAGFSCVSLSDEPTVTVPVCISSTIPALCPGAIANPNMVCDMPVARCFGPNALIRPWNAPTTATCGSEVVACPTQCLDDSSGLSPDAGAATLCN